MDGWALVFTAEGKETERMKVRGFFLHAHVDVIMPRARFEGSRSGQKP